MPDISKLTLDQLNELEEAIPAARSKVIAYLVREALKPLGLEPVKGESFSVGNQDREHHVQF